MKALIISMISYYFLLWFSDVVIGQMITGIVTIVIAWIAYQTSVKVKKLADRVDGRLTEILELTKSDYRQRGAEEGRQQQKEEAAPQNSANIEAAKAKGNLEGREKLLDEQDPNTDTKPHQ